MLVFHLWQVCHLCRAKGRRLFGRVNKFVCFVVCFFVLKFCNLKYVYLLLAVTARSTILVLYQGQSLNTNKTTFDLHATDDLCNCNQTARNIN